MDAIAKTAYYCCGVRALDAASPNPICGDTFAQRFMTAEAQAVFEPFAALTMPNRSNATRARIIDDWLRERLRANPNQRVIVLGAGFDTRAFRLTGGRWLEVDHPAIIAIKSEALPEGEAPNSLARVAINFAVDALSDKLAPFTGERGSIVVMEGVSMYLSQDQLKATLSTLRRCLADHTLVCDLMTATFLQRYGGKIRQLIGELGGHFATLVDNPAATVTGCGYVELSRVSMVARARELGAVPIPGFLLNTVFRSLRDGLCAYQFQARR